LHTQEENSNLISCGKFNSLYKLIPTSKSILIHPESFRNFNKLWKLNCNSRSLFLLWTLSWMLPSLIDSSLYKSWSLFYIISNSICRDINDPKIMSISCFTPWIWWGSRWSRNQRKRIPSSRVCAWVLVRVEMQLLQVRNQREFSSDNWTERKKKNSTSNRRREVHK
jgi:hypothetical protein